MTTEELAEALPDWMVEHPMGLTEHQLRMEIATVILARLPTQGTSIPPLPPANLSLISYPEPDGWKDRLMLGTMFGMLGFLVLLLVLMAAKFWL